MQINPKLRKKNRSEAAALRRKAFGMRRPGRNPFAPKPYTSGYSGRAFAAHDIARKVAAGALAVGGLVAGHHALKAAKARYAKTPAAQEQRAHWAALHQEHMQERHEFERDYGDKYRASRKARKGRAFAGGPGLELKRTQSGVKRWVRRSHMPRQAANYGAKGAALGALLLMHDRKKGALIGGATGLAAGTLGGLVRDNGYQRHDKPVVDPSTGRRVRGSEMAGTLMGVGNAPVNATKSALTGGLTGAATAGMGSLLMQGIPVALAQGRDGVIRNIPAMLHMAGHAAQAGGVVGATGGAMLGLHSGYRYGKYVGESVSRRKRERAVIARKAKK